MLAVELAAFACNVAQTSMTKTRMELPGFWTSIIRAVFCAALPGQYFCSLWKAMPIAQSVPAGTNVAARARLGARGNGKQIRL